MAGPETVKRKLDDEQGSSSKVSKVGFIFGKYDSKVHSKTDWQEYSKTNSKLMLFSDTSVRMASNSAYLQAMLGQLSVRFNKEYDIAMIMESTANKKNIEAQFEALVKSKHPFARAKAMQMRFIFKSNSEGCLIFTGKGVADGSIPKSKCTLTKADGNKPFSKENTIDRLNAVDWNVKDGEEDNIPFVVLHVEIPYMYSTDGEEQKQLATQSREIKREVKKEIIAETLAEAKRLNLTPVAYSRDRIGTFVDEITINIIPRLLNLLRNAGQAEDKDRYYNTVMTEYFELHAKVTGLTKEIAVLLKKENYTAEDEQIYTEMSKNFAQLQQHRDNVLKDMIGLRKELKDMIKNDGNKQRSIDDSSLIDDLN